MAGTYIINKATIQRLVSDIFDITNSPLINEGIYYSHDENDMLKGYALIIGPKDTVYFGGFYFFEFNFPYNYPHSPPKVIFHTNDGLTRFHPNLYKNGKCCLSILNTWRGEQWTGCQTLRSILMSILSIFDNKPLLNEPGITEKHRDYKTYNKIIRYKNIKIAVLEMMNSKSSYYPKKEFNVFEADMEKEFKKNRYVIKNFLRKASKKKIRTRRTDLYGMSICIDYMSLWKSFVLFLDNKYDEKLK